MTVYGDILFIYNFALNTFILYISGTILKYKINRFRIISGGVFGGLYGVFTVMLKMNFFFFNFMKLFFALVMLFIAYRESLYGYLKLYITMLLVSFCMCGAVTAFNFSWGGAVSGEFVAVCCVLTFFLMKKWAKMTYRRFTLSDMYKRVEIFMNGKKTAFTGFVDTGNFVVEPVSGNNVMFVETLYLKKILDRETFEAVKNLGLSGTVRLYPLRIKTVSSVKTVMCFKPDKILVDKDEKEYMIAAANEGFKDGCGAVIPAGGEELNV